MGLYEKILVVKTRFHEAEIKKTGYNNYSNYYYMKLDDFLKDLLALMNEEKLLSFVSFTSEIATLTVVDVTSNDKLEITSPMSTAKLTACHEVQNLGAVQTYIRRYLYMALFDIMEDDALDSSVDTKKQDSKPNNKPVDEKKITVTDIEQMAVKANIGIDFIINSYNEKNEKKISELKYMPQDSKQATYTWLKGKVK